MLNRHFFLIAATLTLLTPSLLFARNLLEQFVDTVQQVEQDSEKRWLRPPDERRAYVKITNDWRDTIQVTMWTRRGTQIGSSWTIRSGRAGYLKEGGERITATEDYNIRVGDDPTAARVGDVGERRGDAWYINVRDVYRATHRYGRGRRGVREDEGIDQGY
jgi:hypothetical protein